MNILLSIFMLTVLAWAGVALCLVWADERALEVLAGTAQRPGRAGPKDRFPQALPTLPRASHG